MSTESIQSKSLTLSKHRETYGVFLTLTNAAGVTLNDGDEVNIKAATDLSVEKRNAGTDFPIGRVTTGGVNGDLVTVFTIFQATLKAHSKVGTINAGEFAVPNGTTNADGKPEYIKTTTAGDYVLAVTIKGGLIDTEIELGILRAPFKI